MNGKVESDGKGSVKGGCKVLGALTSVMSCRTFYMAAKGRFHQDVGIPTLFYEAKT